MQSIDHGILVFFNQAAQHWSWFDNAIIVLSNTDFVKGGMDARYFWGPCGSIAADSTGVQRERLLAGMARCRGGAWDSCGRPISRETCVSAVDAPSSARTGALANVRLCVVFLLSFQICDALLGHLDRGKILIAVKYLGKGARVSSAYRWS